MKEVTDAIVETEFYGPCPTSDAESELAQAHDDMDTLGVPRQERGHTMSIPARVYWLAKQRITPSVDPAGAGGQAVAWQWRYKYDDGKWGDWQSERRPDADALLRENVLIAEEKRPLYTHSSPSIPLRDEVERVLREHIKVDATGLAPAVASTLLVGFEDAASALLDRCPDVVERFNVDVEKNEDGYWEGVLLISASGEWVRLSDYEAQEELIKHLQAENDRYEKELAETKKERDELKAEVLLARPVYSRRQLEARLDAAETRAIEAEQDRDRFIEGKVLAEARADALAVELGETRLILETQDQQLHALAKKVEKLEGALREIEGRDSSIDASPRGDRKVILGQFARRARAALLEKKI